MRRPPLYLARADRAFSDTQPRGLLRKILFFFLLTALASGFSISPAHASVPTITSLSTVYGPIAGGTTTVITGTNFTGTTSVSVGGATATINSITDTSLSITTPGSASTGARNVVVTNGNGSATSTNAFSYVDSVVNCGTSGAFFITNNIVIDAKLCVGSVVIPSGVTSIAFCAMANSTANESNCTGHSGNAITTVTLPSSIRSLGAAAFMGLPTMSSINLPEGLLTIGRDVLYGSGRFSITIPTTVTNINAAFYRANLTDVFFSTPSSLTSFGQDTFRAMPNLTSLVIPEGVTTLGNISVGDTVASALRWVSLPSTLTTVANTGNTAFHQQPLTCVANPGNTAFINGLTFSHATPTRVTNLSSCPTPTITAINANSGKSQGGVRRSISGTNLITVHTVTIGGAPALIETRTATALSIVTPAGTLGARDVVLSTFGHTVTSAGGYTYVPESTITSLSVTSGVVTGGTSVTVTGTNLDTITAATLGGVTLVRVSNNSTSYVFTTPAGTAGAKDLVLTNVNGPVTLVAAFTYFELTSTFSVFSVAGSVRTSTINTPLVITATVEFASRITFRYGNTRIAGCISRRTPVSAPFTVTCSWRPTRKGAGSLTATAIPNGAGILSGFATPINMTVAGRTNRR